MSRLLQMRTNGIAIYLIKICSYMWEGNAIEVQVINLELLFFHESEFALEFFSVTVQLGSIFVSHILYLYALHQ